jgi:hypothetical protein
MAKGFIYVITTVTKDYVQGAFFHVPTEWENRIYFGPCKKTMRPKMWPGYWVFGISPKNGTTRRIVFAAQIEERITFGEAYDRFPDLCGPEGPIHVTPVSRRGRFPESSYQHIPGANHPDNWQTDLATEQLDAFFVCAKGEGWRGRWLGEFGPKIDNEMLTFLKTCSVYGSAGLLGAENRDATLENPIVHRGPKGLLFTGLYLETDEAESLLELCAARLPGTLPLDRAMKPQRHVRVGGGECGPRKSPSQSWSKKRVPAIKGKC